MKTDHDDDGGINIKYPYEQVNYMSRQPRANIRMHNYNFE